MSFPINIGIYIKYISINSDKIKSYTLDNFDYLLKSCSKVNMEDSKIPLLLLSAKNSQKLETHYFSSTCDKDVSLLDAVKSCIADKLHFSPHILDKQGYFDHSFISKSSFSTEEILVYTTFVAPKVGINSVKEPVPLANLP